MIEINLLPKDYLKRSSSLSLGKSGIYAAAGGVGVIAMLIGITVYQMKQVASLETNINRANERAAMLQKDIQVVDALTDVKDKINRRMSAVERLDRHRSVWVRILSDVASDVPEFVWLAGFKEKPEEAEKPNSQKSGIPQNKPAEQQASAPRPDSLPSFRPVEIEGYAYTLNSLAAFMINLMRSDYFDQVELVKTEESKFQNDEKAYNFIVSANVHFLSDQDLQGLVASAENDNPYNDADFEAAEEPPTPGPSGHTAGTTTDAARN
jgi:Tfp pilus assembly protein PilN